MKVKEFENVQSETGLQVVWAASGPDWMPQALKPLCMVHIGSCKNLT